MSNELDFQRVFPSLPAGIENSAFLGVGPEQNYSYVSLLRPTVAFVIDRRRNNALLHVLYKVLFAACPDRMSFVCSLFGWPLGIFDKGVYPKSLRDVPFLPQQPQARRAFLEILDQHNPGWISPTDRLRLARLHETFVRFGPRITMATARGAPERKGRPTFADLMDATDSGGRQHSFLSSEENYSFVRDFSRRNALIPIVGDIAGPCIGRIGEYLFAQGLVVTVFYISNVAVSLQANGTWPDFIRNLTTLPRHPAGLLVQWKRPPIALGIV